VYMCVADVCSCVRVCIQSEVQFQSEVQRCCEAAEGDKLSNDWECMYTCMYKQVLCCVV